MEASYAKWWRPYAHVFHPRDGSDIILYCRAGELRIYTQQEWDEKKAEGKPLASLSRAEGAAIAWFLRYWLGEDNLKPGYHNSLVDAEFDF
jgi:hypothetical protein